MKAAAEMHKLMVADLERQTAALWSVPPMTFARDDNVIGCSEDGFSFSFDRMREDIEVRCAPHIERTGEFQIDSSRGVPNLRTARQAPSRRRSVYLGAAVPIAAVVAIITAAAAGAWAALAGLVALVRDRYIAWRDAPLRERAAQLEELAAIRAGALDHARYATENGMPLSAAAMAGHAAEACAGPDDDGGAPWDDR